ncbi:unnamed protein product [Ectocarpus sp. CCAP 1310/34]|nr:unnamed protein product [Ectocarpus sp. CCAP 1310/34]
MLNRFNVTTTAPTPAVVDDDLGPKRDDESSVDKPVREAIGSGSARSKHIDVRFHFIRELFKAGKITADYVSTEEQHADMLTKVLGRGKLEYHRKALMNLPM